MKPSRGFDTGSNPVGSTSTPLPRWGRGYNSPLLTIPGVPVDSCFRHTIRLSMACAICIPGFLSDPRSPPPAPAGGDRPRHGQGPELVRVHGWHAPELEDMAGCSRGDRYRAEMASRGAIGSRGGRGTLVRGTRAVVPRKAEQVEKRAEGVRCPCRIDEIASRSLALRVGLGDQRVGSLMLTPMRQPTDSD